MNEISFFEFDALETAIVDAARILRLEAPPTWILDRINTELADRLNDTLIDFLNKPELVDGVEIHETRRPLGQARGLDLRLRRNVKSGATDKVRFFKIGESWKSGHWALVALTVGLILASPTVIIPTAALIENFFRNLITLERPKDSRAIDAYAGFLKARSELVRVADPERSPYPSTAAIHSHSGHVDPKDTTLGLTCLHHRNILIVDEWGGEPNDNAHPENLWKEAL